MFTADTLRHFHTEGFLPTELYFIAGADAFLEIATWKDYPAVLDLAHFSVVARPGVKVSELPARLPALAARMQLVDAAAPRRVPSIVGESTLIFLIDATTADVSSTAIRQARQHHQSIAGMVPPSVQQHIEQHALYGALPPAAGNGAGVSSLQAGRLHGQN